MLETEVRELAELLKRVSEEHHKFELSSGPDGDWPLWYAERILKEGYSLVKNHGWVNPKPSRKKKEEREEEIPEVSGGRDRYGSLG